MSTRVSSAPRLLRSRFFWNLFLSLAAVLVTTGALVAWRVSSRLEASLLQDLQRTLESHGRVLAPFARDILRSGGRPGLQAELASLPAEAGLRVTYVLADGRVAADSSEEPARMDDHSDRPEIAAARIHAFGVSRRRSHTLGVELLYVAHRIEEQGRLLGFVRLAMPVREVEEQIALARRSVLLGTSGGVLLALFLGVVLARRVADQLMAHDAIGAHARDELGISATLSARPVQAALTSAATFSVGAAMPLLMVVIAPASVLVPLVSAASLGFLALLGAIGARAGGANMLRPTIRVTFWGALAMGLTAGIGKLFGTVV